MIFCLDCINAIKPSKKSKKNALDLLKKLLIFDLYNLTEFEFSFKVKKNKIVKDIRFLSMDHNGYSCQNPRFFLKRVMLFEKIMATKCKNKDHKKVNSALRKVSKHPMDLYFGFDIKGGEYVFAFWLIFGGVKRNGKVSFWPYNFTKIINSSLKDVGLKKPKTLKRDILNLGFDIYKNEIRYKLYYLCRKMIMRDSAFAELMSEINSKFAQFKYFYFFSEMYNHQGKLVREKMFLEFLEDIRNEDEKMIDTLLIKLKEIIGFSVSLGVLKTTLRKCGGRISLISFELDGTLTFYIRST